MAKLVLTRLKALCGAVAAEGVTAVPVSVWIVKRLVIILHYRPHLLVDCRRVWDLVKCSTQSQVSVSWELVECHQASLPSQGTFKAVRLAQCFLEII